VMSCVCDDVAGVKPRCRPTITVEETSWFKMRDVFILNNEDVQVHSNNNNQN